MTPDDPLVAFHLRASSVMRLATTSVGGTTTLTPIWFVLHRGLVVCGTGASTRAARNAAADPRVTALFDAEDAGPAAHLLRVRGTAEVHRGSVPPAALARFALKYHLRPGGARSELVHAGHWGLRRRYHAQSDAVWIGIRPGSAELVPVPRSGISPPGGGR